MFTNNSYNNNNQRHLRVSDQFRKNELSLQPGGVVVEVHWANGLVLAYDKVKYPDSYIAAILNAHQYGMAEDPQEVERQIVRIMINDESYFPTVDDDLPWVDYKNNSNSYYRNRHKYTAFA